MSASRTCLPAMAPVLAVIVLVPAAAWGQGVKLDDPELARAADVIVTGRVTRIAYGRDPQVPYLYTYVTIEVAEPIKGFGIGNEIIVKQLGGQSGDLRMVVPDQATFSFGEEVLLFLVERPRDGTLQTAGLWQGKWTVDRDPDSGAGVVTRSPFAAFRRPSVGSAYEAEDFRLLDPFIAELKNWSRRQDGVGAPRRLKSHPVEAPAAIIDRNADFVLLGPARWNQADSAIPVRVDIQASGQPTLAGGGFAEIGTARSLWNNAGSRLTLAPGNMALSGASTAAVCNDTDNSGSGKITVYFDDPCDELDNETIAAIGGWFSTFSGGETVNGQAFARITAGFVINNDGVSSSNYSTCFLDTETHELGHAVGIGHTLVPGNIMNPSGNGACFNGISTGLGNDDRALSANDK